jgi:hypothetical protein
VPCGTGSHTIRWEAGKVRLPSHPDAEAELVLAALGGETPGCIQLAEAWGRHADDVRVLAIWPRGADDEISISWDSVREPGAGTISSSPLQRLRVGRPGQLSPGQLSPGPAAALQAEIDRVAQYNTDVMSLLALGAGFQARLSGHVADAHAAEPTEATRPALTAALSGRLALVAEKWIGIDPNRVKATLQAGDGWGSSEMTGKGEHRVLAFALPAGWLASVWACGLALAGRHLVVAVTKPGWPDAQVIALLAPGTEPVPLDVHGTADAAGNPVWQPVPDRSAGGERGDGTVADAAHWET